MFEVGSWARRRPKKQDYAAARMRKREMIEVGSRNLLKWEVGMRPSTSSGETKSEIKHLAILPYTLRLFFQILKPGTRLSHPATHNSQPATRNRQAATHS